MEIYFDDWIKEAKKRYGDDQDSWKFRCPLCKVETSIKEWKDNKADGMIAFSCIGRSLKEKVREAFDKGKGPCNYAGGGLFQLNPVTVIKNGEKGMYFDFAKDPLVKEDEVNGSN